MKKHYLLAVLLLVMLLAASFSYADDVWTPRMTDYTWMDTVRAGWVSLWKFLGAI